MSYFALEFNQQKIRTEPTFTTNQIIQVKMPQHTIYYIPVFVRIDIKNLVSLDVEGLNASLRATLMVRFVIDKWQQYILKTSNKQRYEHLYQQLTSRVTLKFSKNDSIILLKDQENPSIILKKGKGYVQFVINQVFDMDIFPQKFWLSPFQLLRLSFYIQISTLETEFNGISFKLAFNCMDCFYQPQQRYKVKQSIKNFIGRIDDQVKLLERITIRHQLQLAEQKNERQLTQIVNKILSKQEINSLNLIKNELQYILQASDYKKSIEDQKQTIRAQIIKNAKNSFQTLKTIYKYQKFIKELIQSLQIRPQRQFDYKKMSYNVVRNSFGPYHMATKMNNVSFLNKNEPFQYRNDQVHYKDQTRSKQHLPKIYFQINSQQYKNRLKNLLEYEQQNEQHSENPSENERRQLLPIRKQSAMKPERTLSQFEPFKYAIFSTYLYKQPFSDIAVIFFPLWLQGLINTATFFIQDNIADRLSILSAIIIAFVALVPTVRQKLPPTDQITLIEIIIYLFTATSLLVLLQTFYIHNNDQFQFNPLNDPVVQIMLSFSIAINVITIVIVAILYVAFVFIWKPSYIYKQQTIQGQKKQYNNKNKKDNKKNRKINKSMELWSGGYCDHQFQKHILQIRKTQKLIYGSEQGQSQEHRRVEFNFIQTKFDI